ncbi:MAG: nodulation protein NfeD, partial [Ectothiorhodospiraceae bacterium]|nr:nodulation protein NfeD [Ectothiorhodospiraceae bacterium]
MSRYLFLFLFLLLVGLNGSHLAANGNRAMLFEVDGAIGPATVDYLQRGFRQARDAGAPLIILRMDTPGGLDTSMRDVIRWGIDSPVPVATYVAPGGARAASAGTYILYASHVAAMAPGTNLGAATPVQIGGGGPGFPGGGDDDEDENGEADNGEEDADREQERDRPRQPASA